MVEAPYLPHNYELTTSYLDLKAHYVTVWHNWGTFNCAHFAPVKIKNNVWKREERGI